MILRWLQRQAVSALPVPVRYLPEVVVPAALMNDHVALHGGRSRPIDLRENVVIADDDVVELDEHRRALHRVELVLGLTEDIVIILVLPAGDVAALPLVLLGCQFP